MSWLLPYPAGAGTATRSGVGFSQRFFKCCKARYCVGICFDGVCSECFRYADVSSSQSARNLSSHSWSFTATSSLQSTCDEFALPVAMNCEFALKFVGSVSRSPPDIDWISVTISLCLSAVTAPSVNSCSKTACIEAVVFPCRSTVSYTHLTLPTSDLV